MKNGFTTTLKLFKSESYWALIFLILHFEF